MPIKCRECWARLPSYAYLIKIYKCEKCRAKEKKQWDTDPTVDMLKNMFWMNTKTNS